MLWPMLGSLLYKISSCTEKYYYAEQSRASPQKYGDDDNVVGGGANCELRIVMIGPLAFLGMFTTRKVDPGM